MSAPLTSPDKVLEFVEIAGAIMDKTAALVDSHTEQQKKIAELIPGVVSTLIKHERIDATEKEAAEKLLLDPVVVLKLLEKVAKHRNTAEQASLGRPVTKTASTKTNSEKSESYMAFERGLGLA